GVANVDRAGLLFLGVDHRGVTDHADGDLVAVVGQRLFVADQLGRTVVVAGGGIQRAQQWQRDGVALLLGQIALDLDDGVFGAAHVPLEAVGADVLLEELVVPLLDSIGSGNGGICHDWIPQNMWSNTSSGAGGSSPLTFRDELRSGGIASAAAFLRLASASCSALISARISALSFAL